MAFQPKSAFLAGLNGDSVTLLSIFERSNPYNPVQVMNHSGFEL